MDFALSEEQRLLVETARRFVRTELMPLERELEHAVDADHRHRIAVRLRRCRAKRAQHDVNRLCAEHPAWLGAEPGQHERHG